METIDAQHNHLDGGVVLPARSVPNDPSTISEATTCLLSRHLPRHALEQLEGLVHPKHDQQLERVAGRVGSCPLQVLATILEAMLVNVDNAQLEEDQGHLVGGVGGSALPREIIDSGKEIMVGGEHLVNRSQRQVGGDFQVDKHLLPLEQLQDLSGLVKVSQQTVGARPHQVARQTVLVIYFESLELIISINRVHPPRLSAKVLRHWSACSIILNNNSSCFSR